MLTEQPQQQAQTQRAPPARRTAHSRSWRQLHFGAADRQKHANVASKTSEKSCPSYTRHSTFPCVTRFIPDEQVFQEAESFTRTRDVRRTAQTSHPCVCARARVCISCAF